MVSFGEIQRDKKEKKHLEHESVNFHSHSSLETGTKIWDLEGFYNKAFEIRIKTVQMFNLLEWEWVILLFYFF